MDKIENIKQELATKGLKWISGEYKNLDSPLELQCIEGHNFFASRKMTRRKSFQCPVCSEETHVVVKKIPKNGIRTLGLDNATIKCGWGVLENNVPIAYGTYTAKSKDLLERIAEIKAWFTMLTDTYEIDVIGFENVFYSGNPQTLIILSMLLGVLTNSAYEKHFMQYLWGANEWRSKIGLKPQKRARDNFKVLAQNYVRDNFQINVGQDTAEAICIAIATYNAYKYDLAAKSGFGK